MRKALSARRGTLLSPPGSERLPPERQCPIPLCLLPRMPGGTRRVKLPSGGEQLSTSHRLPRQARRTVARWPERRRALVGTIIIDPVPTRGQTNSFAQSWLPVLLILFISNFNVELKPIHIGPRHIPERAPSCRIDQEEPPSVGRAPTNVLRGA